MILNNFMKALVVIVYVVLRLNDRPISYSLFSDGEYGVCNALPGSRIHYEINQDNSD